MTPNTKKAHQKTNKAFRDHHNSQLLPEAWTEVERQKAEKSRQEVEKGAAKIAEMQTEMDTDKAQQLQDALSDITAKHHFDSLWDLIDIFFSSKDWAISSRATKLVDQHGEELMSHLHTHNPASIEQFAQNILSRKLHSEACILEDLFGCQDFTTVTTVLEDFSMNQLLDNIHIQAPTLHSLLQTIALSPAKLAVLKGVDQNRVYKKSRRDHELVRSYSR
jgi:hypothetical protein